MLLVEDDAVIRRATELALRRERFQVSVACDGLEALGAFASVSPDVVVLDVMLPGLDGVSVCRLLRAESEVPVVMLSARGDPMDVVRGLEAGADDYVSKPFEVSVLVARLRAVLRRVSSARGGISTLRAGRVSVDLAGAEVRVDGEVVALTPTEHRLLVDLLEHAGHVRSREALLESVWGYDWTGDPRLVDVHVQRLRAKIGRETIETVRGMGYKAVRA